MNSGVNSYYPQRRTVTLTLMPASFALWNDEMRHVVEPGEFEIMTGSSSVELQATTLVIEAGR